MGTNAAGNLNGGELCMGGEIHPTQDRDEDVTAWEPPTDSHVEPGYEDGGVSIPELPAEVACRAVDLTASHAAKSAISLTGAGIDSSLVTTSRDRRVAGPRRRRRAASPSRQARR